MGVLCALLLAAIGSYRVFGPERSTWYEVSVNGNILTIDCGEFLSVYEPLELRVPLSLLGLSAGSVKKTISTCSCTIPEVGPDDDELLITYEFNSRKVDFYEAVTIIPNDERIGKKFVRLRGKIIPAWFARPPSIDVGNVRPGEARRFSATAEINYELGRIGVGSVKLSPQADNITLDYEIVSNERIALEGVVKGLPCPDTYKGQIKIVFSTGKFEELRLPINVGYLGTISAIPEVVSFDGEGQEETVEFAHFNGNPLDIEQIRCPEHLMVSKVASAEDRCLVKIGLKNGVLGQKNEVLASKVEVDFAGIDQPGVVRVMILPAAL